MTKATFIPDSLPDEASYAEREVLQALKDTLGPGWTVFSSVRWTWRNSQGKFHDGEADLVLYHPQFALLVIEVKGGSIDFKPEKGHWFTTPAGKAPKRLKESPFQQARSNLYSILKLLERHTGPSRLPLNWGHGVVFPAVDDLTGLIDKHPEAPDGLVAGRQDLPYLGEWCEQLARGWQKAPVDNFVDFKADPERFSKRGTTPADTISNFLRVTLSPPVHLPAGLSLREGIKNEHEEIIKLSANQCRVLSPLQRNRRLAVSGGAGTGKTLLALNKALTFARTGIPTLFTCYNRVLAASMKLAAERTLKASGDEWVLDTGLLTVQTLTDYVAGLVDTSEESLVERGPDYWTTLPKRYWKWRSQQNLPAENFIQAIILDEGQDFSAEWWHIIPTLVSSPEEDFIWTFYDNNQSIYAEGLGEDATGYLPGAVPVDLDENFRNTKEIYSAFKKYCDSGELRALGPNGREPEKIEIKRTQSCRAEIEQVVHRLVDEEKLPPHAIALLTPTRSSSELFVSEIAGYPTQTSGEISAGKIVVETIHSFKGQESPVVILAEMHLAHPQQEDRLRYIAMSRAVNHLVEVASTD